MAENSNVDERLTAKSQRTYFFGEDHRVCCQRVHIINAAMSIVFLDVIKFIIEMIFFYSKIGFVDSVSCIHLVWAFIAYTNAFFAFVTERSVYFWPLLSLKICECLVAGLCLGLILILGVIGPIGNSLLRVIIIWKYRRIESEEAISFSLVLFLVIALLFAFNSFVLDILIRTQRYCRNRAMASYLIERERTIRILR